MEKEKKKMSRKKKVLLIIAVIFGALILLCAGLALWQRENINAFLLSRQYSSEELLAQLSENDRKLKQEVEKYFSDGIRDFTEEEKELIESGQVSEKQMLAKIISEGGTSFISVEELYNKIAEEQKKANTDVEITFEDSDVIVPVPITENKEEEIQNSDKKTIAVVGKPAVPEADVKNPEAPPVTADAVISKYVSQLYILEEKYIGAIEGVVAAAKSDAKAKGLTKKDTSELLAIGANYTNTVNALEARCDGEVEAIITNLTNELNAINADTSIIATIREAYENEKSLKRAYYMNMVYS